MSGLGGMLSKAYGKAVTNWYMQYRRYKKLSERLGVEQEFSRWHSRRPELLAVGQNGYHLKVTELGLRPENLARLEEQAHDGQAVVIADVDRNGLLLSHFGPIENARMVTSEEFLARTRFPVQVVAVDEYVGVRKRYVGAKQSFVNELRILHCLGLAGCHVPAILAVDFENLSLTVSYIAGRVLKEELAAHGAELFAKNPDKKHGSALSERPEIRSRRAREGKRLLDAVVDDQFIEGLYQELCTIHAAGVLDIDIKYGNIIIEKRTGQPYWIDFDHATYYPRLSARAFRILTARDIYKFNLFFGTNKRNPVKRPLDGKKAFA